MKQADTKDLISPYSSTANDAVRNIKTPLILAKPYLASADLISERRQTVAINSLDNHLLSSLERSSLLRLLPFMERVNVKNSECLFFSEQKIQHIYFPESAIVSEVQILEDGRTIEISMTGKESAIALPSIFNDKLTSSWVQAIMPGSALRVNTDTLRGIMEKDGLLRSTLFQHLSAYIKQLTQKVVCHRFHSVEERFCAWLLMFNRKKAGGGLAVTQEKIARLLGVHRPSLTPIALSLKNRKIINYVRGRIFILDPHELKKYACGCYL